MSLVSAEKAPFCWNGAMLIRLVFDNWRVLHGRSAFSGRREMCGGYSVFISKRA